jgi:hypothetical protein
MTIERLREARDSSPFTPFTLSLADGRRFRVPHRDFVWFPPHAQRTVVVAGEQPESHSIIDVLMITSLDFESAGRNGEPGNGHPRAR